MTSITNLEQANSTIADLRAEIERLKGQLELLRAQTFGRRREKIDPKQLLLFESNAKLLEQLQKQVDEAQTEKPEKEKSEKKGHGRAPFADHLPREQVDLDVPETERLCECCGEAMHLIGTEVTERAHIIPAQVVVKRYCRNKYACPHGHSLKTAPLPDGVVDKGKYEASVYAHVITSKYGDHQPLHRLQSMFRRQGVHLPKQSMWDLLVRFDELAGQPILAEMRRQLLEEQDLQADETPIKVQLEGKQRGTRRGILWVWRNVRGSPQEKVVADFKDDRSARGPDAFLGSWSGNLLTDGYDGVNPVANRNNITRSGCWAHARRKFRDALSTGAAKAGAVLRPIQRLFWIERAIKRRAERDELDFAGLEDLRQRIRGRRSKAVLRGLYEIVFALQDDPATQSNEQLRKAVTYVIRQRDPLLAHLDNGRIPIHNNDTERDLRHVVTGRKNWMTFGSERGGLVAGRLYSLVMSAKLAGINVETYLEDVLVRIATTPASCIAELTPWGWAEARAAEIVDSESS
ncbi:MAG: IS66 family transposase [Myxococcota bacterium]